MTCLCPAMSSGLVPPLYQYMYQVPMNVPSGEMTNLYRYLLVLLIPSTVIPNTSPQVSVNECTKYPCIYQVVKWRICVGSCGLLCAEQEVWGVVSGKYSFLWSVEISVYLPLFSHILEILSLVDYVYGQCSLWRTKTVLYNYYYYAGYNHYGKEFWETENFTSIIETFFTRTFPLFLK